MPGYVLHTVPTHDKGSSTFYSPGGWVQSYEAMQKTRAQRAVQDMHHCKRSWSQCKPCDHMAMLAVACRYTFMLQARVTHRKKPCQTLETQLGP